jgi:subtilisin family serine protease
LKKRRLFLGATTILVVLAFIMVSMFTAKAADEGEARSYLVISQSHKLPRGIAEEIQAFNGEITSAIPEVGVVVVASADPNFPYNASLIRGIRSVVPNIEVQWIDPGMGSAVEANPPSIGDDEPYFWYQWALDAIDAPEAWNTGQLGSGVRVCVLDSGIDAEHVDIAPNLNTSLCASFVPGEDWNIQPGSYFNHGTHVAGIIGAAHNGAGIIGVAPEAELVAVKVLSEYTGSGSFDWLISAIVYSALIDADVINMSLGANFRKSGYYDPRTPNDKSDDVYLGPGSIAELKNLISRATTFAYQMGTLVVCSAGNDAGNGDKDADWIHLPSDAVHALSTSATAPYGWIYDITTDLDVPSHFTNFGQSVIDFAAPGGDYDHPGAYVYDMVLSTSSQSYYFAAGTSQAAPHVSGVAALIIGAYGGAMHPADVIDILRQSADDLGKPGKDDYYGHGRVNAYNAVN